MLTRCDEVVVLMLPGWETSVGVRDEIAVARELGKPVRFLSEDEATGSPTLARVAAGSREADLTPTGADRPSPLAQVASEVPG